MSDIEEGDLSLGDEPDPKDEPLEGEIITDPPASKAGFQGNQNTRNILIGVAVVILLFCCCCAILVAVFFASGVPNELMRGF